MRSRLVFTDIRLLRCIQALYEEKYLANQHKVDAFNYVPISCADVAKEMGADQEVIFQRLAFHLNHKYSYTQDDNSLVYFFWAFDETGRANHRINYPYLCAVLADMESQEWKNRTAIIIALFSVAVSVVLHFV